MQVKYPVMGLSYAHGYFAICGGGGSLKSGIKNTVDIYQLSDSDPTGFVKDISADTGIELASGVAFSHDGVLIAVSVNASCWIYEIDKQQKAMKLLITFRTDFAAEESSQTSACFVGNGTLLTGGEDGVVRVWQLSQDLTPHDKAAGTSSALASATPDNKPSVGDIAVSDSYKVTLTREYRGHTKRIREIHVEPSHRNLVASSSEDQSCHLWRLNEFSPVFKFSKDDAIDTAYQMLKLKPLVGVKKHQFRCVRFSNDGRSLFTVLTPARGDTLLLKWKPITTTQTKTDEWMWVIDAAAVTGDRPVASLCVSHDDCFVSTAAVSGEVRVYETTALRSYKRHGKIEHNFAITGMSFVIPSHPRATALRLVTGGADKMVLCHIVPREGGEVIPGMVAFRSAIKSFFSGIIRLFFSLGMGAIVLFILLLFIHAQNALLMNGPLTGLEDLTELRFESDDAVATFGSVAVAFVLTLVSFFGASTIGTLFWNGVVCTLSMLVAFFVAISPDHSLYWATGDALFDELLDYKISIVLGGLSILFFFVHSLLIKLR
ncbi:hypothetical protein Poli38472_014006 [Pythium oligandrum]|uniref:Uncharacterized protein n=1 Tax=Pythium oligandrum TaxID=41045 RepID=A0A8K1CP65_PYTOL|nr:hypothetical protein Poli38472_014006 [Pythium oligandrum]|eukprot:TMW66694.1 hypothetical protein Poli38472_014006 [Pythium oligandrum]